MIKLNPSSFGLLKKPLKSVNINHLFALAVAEKMVEGEVLVDEIKNPQTFYIKHPYGMSLLFGACTNHDFNTRLKSYLLNEDKKRSQPEWLQVYPNCWHDKLKQLLNNRKTSNCENANKVVVDSRINFTFKEADFTRHEKTNSSDFIMKRTGKEEYRQIEGLVIPQFFYNNEEHFFNEGVAYSAIYKGTPVATSFAAFIIDKKLEIGIETHPDYKGKGLAKIACSALVEYCLQNNLEPVWSCKGSNVASIKLAESLGFKQILTFPYYKLPCN